MVFPERMANLVQNKQFSPGASDSLSQYPSLSNIPASPNLCPAEGDAECVNQ